MIEAIIFDMDGLLIDSEPLWRIAETKAMNAVGVPMVEDDGFKTMGLRTDEVVEYWYARYPWKTPSKIEVGGNITGNVISLIQQRGESLPGAIEAVRGMVTASYQVGLASSSSMDIIDAVLERIGLRDAFAAIQSAEHEPYGKPHPAVYIECARSLGVAPERCLALEDSPAGVLAAKAAKMRCIAVPPPELRDDHRYCIADLQMESLTQFSAETVASLS